MEDRFPTRYARIEPSLGETLGRAIGLAQRVAVDELRLLQLETQERIQTGARRGAWIALGATCLALAWIAGWAAAVAALAASFPLEIRLAMVAGAHLLIGAILLTAGLRKGKR